jgi:hypothetical protein
MQTKGAVFQQRLASWSEEDLELCTDLVRRLLDMPGSKDGEQP